MKQKTAMQDLISYFKKKGFMYCALKAEELIEKEKEQIMVAYYEGFQDGGAPHNENDNYYYQTYKQD